MMASAATSAVWARICIRNVYHLWLTVPPQPAFQLAALVLMGFLSMPKALVPLALHLPVKRAVEQGLVNAQPAYQAIILVQRGAVLPVELPIATPVPPLLQPFATLAKLASTSSLERVVPLAQHNARPVPVRPSALYARRNISS